MKQPGFPQGASSFPLRWPLVRPRIRLIALPQELKSLRILEKRGSFGWEDRLRWNRTFFFGGGEVFEMVWRWEETGWIFEIQRISVMGNLIVLGCDEKIWVHATRNIWMLLSTHPEVCHKTPPPRVFTQNLFKKSDQKYSTSIMLGGLWS